MQPWYQDKCQVQPFSLLYMKYYLEDHGYDRSRLRILDCSHYDKDNDQVIEILKQAGPKPIIGVTAYSKERFHAYDLVRRIRKEIPDCTIVAGGRHFGYLAKESLENLPEIDMVVSGEGEVAFKEVCDALQGDQNFKGIQGLFYREDGKIVQNMPRALENDLDKFRMFDPTDVNGDYPKTLSTKVDKDKYFIVFATRGCPFKCTFCSLTATRPRYRSVDKVLEEIQQKIEMTGVRNVRFGDSSLTISKKWMREFCEKVIARNMKIRWACYSRVDIELELLTLMRNAGMVSAEVALESGSEKILKNIKKSIDLEMFENFAKESHRLGIKLWVFTIISSPGETLEDVDMTLNLIRKVSKYIYAAGMQTTRLLPDASLIHEAKLKGVIPKDFDWFKPFSNKDLGIARDDFDTLPLYLENLTVEQINKKITEFNEIIDRKFATFYFLKKSILYNLKPRRLKVIFSSREHVLRATRRGAVMLWNAIKNAGREKHFEMGM
jgi:radical SAM superfamily enzyme YgiQ (UPF0313 family)